MKWKMFLSPPPQFPYSTLTRNWLPALFLYIWILQEFWWYFYVCFFFIRLLVCLWVRYICQYVASILLGLHFHKLCCIVYINSYCLLISVSLWLSCRNVRNLVSYEVFKPYQRWKFCCVCHSFSAQEPKILYLNSNLYV